MANDSLQEACKVFDNELNAFIEKKEKLEKDSDAIRALGKKIETVFVESKKFDKDIELQKIQIVTDNFQTDFTLGGSIMAGAFIGLLVLILTIYFKNPIGAIILVVLLGAFFYIAFSRIGSRNGKFLELVDEWIKKIENKESLQSITEMKKEIAKRTKVGLL